MNPSPLPKSRLQLVRERTAQGQVRDDAIQRTRLLVSIDKLIEDPNNERKTLSNIEEMVASVKAHGIIEPITVVALDDGRYQIVTGHRRYRAAKLAGLRQVEILVRQPEDHQRRRIKSLISNIQRENVPPLELALAIHALISEEGLNQQQVADQLGKSKAWVSAVLRILDLSDAAKQKVGCTQLSIDALTRIARLDDSVLQVELIDGLLAGTPQGEIRERIKQADRGQKPKLVMKAKRMFRTRHEALVTVESDTSRLTGDQLIAALQEALEEASKGKPSP
jgi:ParB family chromosome partitioning protein